MKWICRALFLGALLFYCPPNGVAQESYRMLDSPQPFTGVESQNADVSQLKSIRIGLFAPDESHGAAARMLIRGVSMALDEANALGGYKGVPFELIQRWADDPWGAGSKEMIRLIYEDRVWIVIGSIAGDSTHVAQQIVTKAYAPLISPIVSDPSLTHINLPWIFRLPPDDRAQALVLMEEGVQKQGLKKVGLLTSTDHDGRYAALELKKVMEEKGVPPVFHFTIAPDADPLEEIAVKVRAFDAEGLVLRYPEKRLSGLLSALKKAGVDVPLYIPWIPGVNADNLTSLYSGTIAVVEPFAVPRHCGPYLKFTRSFIQRFGERPDACAVYAYDAGRLAVEAIRTQGLQRSKLAGALMQLSGFFGLSCPIRWDNGGGNIAKPILRVFPQK